MKYLLRLSIFVLVFSTFACSTDDGDNSPVQQEHFEATINGGTFSNYAFSLGVYQITKSSNGNSLSIEIGDSNGEMLTLFLNETGGFNSNTVKVMGNVDSNNAVTYGLIRQAQSQLSYYSSSGNATITNNRTHPTLSGHRLISGTFNFNATSTVDDHTTTISGSFTDLEYED